MTTSTPEQNDVPASIQEVPEPTLIRIFAALRSEVERWVGKLIQILANIYSEAALTSHSIEVLLYVLDYAYRQ
jgi:hypothetical protein